MLLLPDEYPETGFMRFSGISTDNSTLGAPGTPEYNKLGKIQPISLLENFQTVSKADRSTLKQYMTMKPVKCGFKQRMDAG